MALLVQPVFATAPSTDGKLAELLSIQLYCGVKSTVEGELGLVIGILIMFSAIWSLVRGGKSGPAIVTILFGASITALPTIIESGFTGLGNLMTSSGMSNAAVAFTPPACPKAGASMKTEISKEYETIKKNREEGHCDGGRLDCL